MFRNQHTSYNVLKVNYLNDYSNKEKGEKDRRSREYRNSEIDTLNIQFTVLRDSASLPTQLNLG